MNKLAAFKMEKKRQLLASEGNIKELKKMYSKSLSEIPNLNTNFFWDERIDDITEYYPKDGMTTERVQIAYDFMPPKAKIILDIGVGYGYIESLLSNHKNIKIFGNDISQNAVKNLSKRFKGSFKVESLYKMKYKKNFFDVVFMLEVLEHVPPSKTFKLIKDIKSFLKEKGVLILSVPTNEELEDMKDNINGHVRMYTQDLIKEELRIAGFKVLKIKTLYAFKNLYPVKKILSRVLINKWKPNDIVVVAEKI